METSEIKAVELVRRIRDRHYAQLKDKSPQEVLAFFHEAAEEANREAIGLFEGSRATDELAQPSAEQRSTLASEPLR